MLPGATHPVVRQDIEALRLASALGIVWFHVAAPGGDLAYGGLMVFLALSMFLGGGGAARPLRQTARARARRLLVPWLAWCFVYGAFNLWLGRPALDTSHGLTLALLTGTSIHLWYLPFVFACLLALDALQPRVPRAALAWSGAALALAGIATAPLWRPLALSWPDPLAQWAHAAPAVALGVFMRCADALPRHAAAGAMAGIVGAALWSLPASWVGPAYAVGALAAALVLWGGAAHLLAADLRPLSAATLGLYLGHPLVVVALARAGVPAGAALALGTFAAALAATLMLRRRLPRWAAVLA